MQDCLLITVNEFSKVDLQSDIILLLQETDCFLSQTMKSILDFMALESNFVTKKKKEKKN